MPEGVPGQGGCEFCFQSVRGLVRYVPFGFAPTKLRHFETCSYKISLMTIVTGYISPRDVTSSELSQSRVIVQITITCLFTPCSLYVIAIIHF